MPPACTALASSIAGPAGPASKPSGVCACERGLLRLQQLARCLQLRADAWLRHVSSTPNKHTWPCWPWQSAHVAMHVRVTETGMHAEREASLRGAAILLAYSMLHVSPPGPFLPLN